MNTIKFFVVLLFFCAKVNQLHAQEIILKEKGFVDVYYTSGNTKSLNIPLEKEFKMNFGDPANVHYGLPDKNALANTSAFAIRFRAWTILGELVTHPTVMWSINKQSLQGQKYQVQFSKISKYPDLVKRYNSIKPLSIKAIVGMGLNPKNNFDGGAYTWFKIADNDVVIEKSNISPLTFPTAPINSGEGMQISIDDNKKSFLSDFSRFVTADRPLEHTKFLKSAASVANFAWVKLAQGEARKNDTQFNQNIYLDVKWPLAAIDEIEELYSKYEKGEKSPQEKLNEELTKNNVQSYNQDDEWSKPFEDDVKGVKAERQNNERQTVLIKPNGKVIKAFSFDEYQNVSELKGTNFFNANGYNASAKQWYLNLLNGKGNILKVDGRDRFDQINFKDDNIYLVIDLQNNLYNDKLFLGGSISEAKDAVYSSVAEATNVINTHINRVRESWKKSSSKGGLSIGYETTYTVKKVRQIIADKNLTVISNKEGYIIY